MTRKQKKSKADKAYETFLKILMWVLIAFAAYILVNVSIKTIVPLLHLDDSLPIKNGKVVADELELVHNQGTIAHPRYFSYGKVNPIPGYQKDEESLLSDSNGKKVYRAQTRFILLYQPRRHRKLRKMLVSELQVFIRMRKFNRPKTGREQMSGTSNSHTPIVGRMVLTAMDAMFI